MTNPFTQLKQGALSGVVAVQTSAMTRASRYTEPTFVAKAMLAFGVLFSALYFSPLAQAATAGCQTDAAKKLFGFIQSAAQFMIGIGAVGALGMFAVGALFIMFSAGNEGRARKGMGIVKNTVIALIILAAGAFVKYVVLNIVAGAAPSVKQSNCTGSSGGAGTPGGNFAP